MPFNVYDRNRKYLGFIQSAYPQYTNVFMVASTDVKLSDNDFNINKIKSELAGFLGCKSILGKINELRLTKSIDNIIIKEFGKFKDNTYDELLKLVYLRILRYEEDVYYKSIKKEQINAYFLIDINNVVIENNSIIIDEEIDYINSEKLENQIPMVAKIIDYPRIQIDSISSGQGLLLGADLADLSLRNHVHKTKLKIKSGNFAYELNLPVELYLKKGDTIQIYVDNRVIKRVFCDGIIYDF
ncbi:hypothetical protein LGL55_03860 [Clostridium tagluense]|uniref:hypothetical protein n=1 Tax=Clostridium tagluense TaxID=360422 RepID=UPI001C0D5437|nr:hypothetical protein [Clostridium tagluense]MBU3129255.1 hypothetical protein [Clostridium tagluense]MCB2310256.1 hypothetical protein [Clostridium tagluense]MCB2315102.1 hypothetical protein [Clostridium tagluense]MCB2319956.1 hypothetical protein [Clostridium tagluense]MCB2324845.1 hypothetical protein [Clostridium tagluense]